MRTGSIGPAYRPVIGVALKTAFILLLPLLAMQVTDEVVWDLADFAVAGTLLFSAGLTYKLVSKKMGGVSYRIAIGVTLAAAFLLIWVNLAVGIIGKEGDPANLMYVGVLAVGVIGSIIARFQPRGMARVLLATAIAQVLVAAIALIAGLGSPQSGPGDILMLNGFFVALFTGSAWLFWCAARRRAEQGSV